MMNVIQQFYFENRARFIIVISTILLITAIIELYFTFFVRVTSNDECLWEPKHNSKGQTIIVFELVKVNGVTWNAGIRDGDRFLAINNIKLSNVLEAQYILDNIRAGSYAEYTVARNGKIFQAKVLIKKLVNISNVANSLLALMFMLIGFIVLMAKPNGRVQKLFYLIGAFLVMTSVYIFIPTGIISGSFSGSSLGVGIVALIFSVGLASFPFAFLAFFWTFPRPVKLLQNYWVKRSFFILPGIIALVNFTLLVLMVRYKTIDVTFYNAIINEFTYFVHGAELIAIITLVINFIKLKTREERKPVLVILIACIIAVVAVVYTAQIAPIISDTVFNSPEYYTPIILVVLVPIAFAYSIFKYQLLDVSVVIKNAILYGTATIGLAAMYFLVIYILGEGISHAIGTDFQGIIAGAVFIIFAVIFQSTKDKYHDFLTEKFYPEQFAYQKVLLKFGNDVSTLVGLENILDSMKETFVESLMINRFGVVVKEKKNDRYHLVRSVGISGDELTISSDNLKKAIEEKSLKSSTIVFEQNEFHTVFPEISSRLVDEEIYTIIPMVVKSNIIGILLFGLKHSGSQFAGKDLNLLTVAANQCAISIENARLYESEAEKLKMERDLSLARKIQQGLLPKCIPNINGLDICGEMIPAMQVGGDYYDLIPIPDVAAAKVDSKIFVVVGDVSGKGLPASLYMTKLQTMIQLACTENRTPREIMIELNRRFYNSLERNSFITMTLALFDTETGKVNFCRAGHMPVLTVTNGRVDSYRTQGIGVGLEKGKIFEKTLVEEEVELKSGQVYAFFSDGVTEAMNEKSELFGEEKLSEILKNSSKLNSGEIMNNIWNTLARFRDTADQNDDMTMVIVKVS